MTQRRAFVIGGGVAGICAALRLSDRGFRVELIEAHRWLGGRVFSVPDGRLGGALRDNGPHVILGCYDEFRWLLRKLGTESRFNQSTSLRLAYLERGGRRHVLGLGRLPVALAMPLALARFGGMVAKDKLRLLRGLVATKSRARPDSSLHDWIVRHHQQGAPRDLLWDPLCRAIMNAEADQVATGLFLACLRMAFGGSACRAAIWQPRAAWSEVLGDPARVALGRTATLHLGERVERIEREDRRIGAIVTNRHRMALSADDVCVAAVPWFALAKMLPATVDRSGLDLESAPILSAYFDLRDVALPWTEPLTYMIGGQPFHYIYQAPGQRSAFAMIADGCRSLDGATVAEIERIAREQLAVWLPGLRLPTTTRVRIVRETCATFLPSPQSAQQRPAPGGWPGMSNLFICGEWTNTGLPSTIEGAALSARLAVEAIA